MDDLQKYQIVNKCETIEELEQAVLTIADENSQIQGRNRSFDAKKMSSYVRPVVLGQVPPNFLTRCYGIRQQALYLNYYRI